MFSLLPARFLQPALHSDGIELPAGLHLSESGLHYNKCGCPDISCLSCSRQNGPGGLLPRTQRHKGELSCTSAQPARKTCGACFQTPEGQLTLLQKSQGVSRQVPTSIFSGKCFSQIPHSTEAHWQPLSQRHPKLLPKEGRTAILQLFMMAKPFLPVCGQH